MTETRHRENLRSSQLRFVDVLVACAAVATLFLVVIALGRLTSDLGWDAGTRTAVSVSVTFFGHLVGVVFLVWYLRKRGLGTGLNRLRKDAWHLLWEAPLLIIVATITSALVAEFVLDLPPPERNTQDALTMPPAVHVVRFLTAALVVPLFEELVFRRIFMRYLDRFLPAFLSIFLSAVVFAAVHFNPSVMVGTFIAGIGLALVARRHRSLWASVIAHACNNSFAYLILLITTFG